MNKIKGLIGAGILSLAALSGCRPVKPIYLEGKVIKESGTVVNLVESSGALLGNESVKLGNPNYLLTIETSEGKYIIDVKQHWSKSLAALAEAIEVGDRIKFRTNGFYSHISKDRIANIDSYDIEVLGK